MKSLAYTGSRKWSSMPLFVPEKEIFDTSFCSWESFIPFLKLFAVPEETKEHKDPLFWSNHCPRIKRAIADSFKRTRMENSAVQKNLNHESSHAWFILLVSVQQVIPATLRVLVLTGWLSKTRITFLYRDVDYSQWTWPESGKTLQRTSFKDKLRIHLKRWGTSYNCPVLFSTCSLQHVLFCSHQLSPSAVYSSWRQNRITVSKPIQKVYFVSS